MREEPTKTALVVLDGEAPSLKLLKHFWDRSDLRVCGDGGAEVVIQAGLEPDEVLGDLDSLSPQVRRQIPPEHLLQIPDQNTTDGEKAIHYCLEHGCQQIHILGGMGKRTDHTLYNLSLLKKFKQRECQLFYYTLEEMLYRIDQSTTLQVIPKTRISLLPIFGKIEQVSTTGLLYPIQNQTLEFGIFDSISNVAIGEQVHIHLPQGGELLLSIQLHL